MSGSSSYGSLASFADAESLLKAVAKLREQGYSRLEIYSPFPIDGVHEAFTTSRRDSIAQLVLAGALLGGLGTLWLQWYSSTIAYPIDVGGRPNASWPAFIPPSLEMVFLFAALFGMAGLLFHAGLPRLYHPVFNIEHFARASSHSFFVLIRADDPASINNGQSLQDLLDPFTPLSIVDVPQ